MRLLQYELKKILVRPLTLVVCIGSLVAILFVFYMNFSNSLFEFGYDPDKLATNEYEQDYLVEYGGGEAVRVGKERMKDFEGVWDDERLRDVATRYRAFMDNPDNYSDELDHTAMSMRYMRMMMAGMGEEEIIVYENENPIYALKPEYQWGEYQTWAVMAQWLEANAYNADGSIRTLEEISPHLGEEPELHYYEGVSRLVDMQNSFSGILIALLVLVGIAPLFSMELVRGTEPMLLSMKYGRTRMTTAKIAAAFVYTLLCTLAVHLLFVLLYGFVYGWEGFGASMQLVYGHEHIPFAATFGQYSWMLLGASLFGGLAFCSLVMLLSTLISSPMPALFGAFIYYLGDVLISSSPYAPYNTIAQVLPGGLLVPAYSLTATEPVLNMPQIGLAILISIAVIVIAVVEVSARYRRKR